VTCMAKWFATPLFPTRAYLLRWLAIYSAAAVATGVAFLVVAAAVGAWCRFIYSGCS
jgi:hypothetical protein